jgi:hypothetical protein
LLVGCGYGSGAAVMLVSGCTHVVGLDYLDDLKPEELMRGNTVPPAVSSLGLSGSFTRVDVSSDMRGDILNPDTAEVLRSYTSTGTLVVLDIRVKLRDEVMIALTNLRRFAENAEIIWRFIGTVSDIQNIASTFSASGCLKDIYRVFRDAEWCEVWIHIVFSERTHLVGVSSSSPVSLPSGGERFPDLRILGGGRGIINAMAMGPYLGLSYDEIEANTIVLADALRASVGGLDHRFSYDQFTAVLHANLYAQIQGLKDPLAEILRLIHTGEMRTTVAGRIIVLSWSPQLENVILNLLPRSLPQC